MPALGRREIESQNVGGSKVQSQDQNLIHRICNRGQAGRNRVYDSRQTNKVPPDCRRNLTKLLRPQVLVQVQVLSVVLVLQKRFPWREEALTYLLTK